MSNRVYVAGPYTQGDPEANTVRAIEVGHRLMDLGYAPLIPHLTHYMEKVRKRGYEEWMQMDLAWERAANAVLRLSGPSPGADREVVLAELLGIPVFHTIEALMAGLPVRKEPSLV